jgi:SSS family solute:Na+ symporter
VLMKRLNGKGCLAALVVGFLIGAFRLAVDTPVTLKMAGYEAGYPSGSFLWIVNNMFFQYYSVIIFIVSCAVLIGVSYATEPPAERQIVGLTYAGVTPAQRRESRASWNHWDVINSSIVMLLIVAAYVYFSG